MTDERLAELRMYKPAEVALMLNIPITRLETWVRDDRVPHLRAGVLRGVEFTAEDIRQIGRMLPDLMGGRRGGGQASTPGGTAARRGPAPFGADGRDDRRLGALRAHRPAPRRR